MIKINMRSFFWAMMFGTTVHAYVNILLIGPFKDTYPLAKRYSEFYNVPIFEHSVHLYPPHFIMVSEQKQQVADTIMIDLHDYPHPEKNPNYFISWVKQQMFSSS